MANGGHAASCRELLCGLGDELTDRTWARIWFWWLAAVALSFAVIEALSWYFIGSPAWTLSDTIRRWAMIHHWLPGVVALMASGLWVHFFIQRNRHD